MSDLSLISLKNNLLIDSKYNEVKSLIINRINQLGLTDGKYKLDPEFTTLVCNLVEHLVSKKDKISKKQIAIDVINSMFNLSDEELVLLGKNIDFLCSQNGLIKKVSYYKLFKTGLKEFLFKKH